MKIQHHSNKPSIYCLKSVNSSILQTRWTNVNKSFDFDIRLTVELLLFTSHQSMLPIIQIYCLLFLPVFTIQNECKWGSWTSEIKCEWVNYRCIKGYRRYCLCDGMISMGSACSSNGEKSENYIDTKPFTSNIHSVPGICYLNDCGTYRNWCPWEAWSYWYPVTNRTCDRRRMRKCCKSQPTSGYTISVPNNYGCFTSRSGQNSTSYEVELKEMQCSPYTHWYNILIYIAIGVSCLIVLCVVCRFTRSSVGKIRTKQTPESVSLEEIEPPNIPTAPVELPPFLQPFVIESVIKEPLITNQGLPTTPPSYDETVGFNKNGFSEPMKYTTVPVAEKVMEEDLGTISRRSSSDEGTTRINTENIPPPSYALYSRNPNLFNQNN